MNKFLKDESGVTAIEYGLIASAISVCLLLVMPLIVNGLTTAFTRIGGALK